MELYPKAVDFDEYWDNLRECTRRLIAGDVCLNKNDWNNRISYLLLFDNIIERAKSNNNSFTVNSSLLVEWFSV